MSTFWSVWVMFLVVFNMGLTLFLFIWGLRVRIPTLTDGTTGHVWAHGAIREGVKRLPTWWVLISSAMFIAGIGYLILYPGFGAHEGKLKWTSHGELARDVAANNATLGRTLERFKLYPVEKLARDPVALQVGKRLFEDNCEACHQRSGKGNALVGAPDLTDDVWLYGGDGEAILASIERGRSGVMPPWGSLGEQNVKILAQYVLSLSGREHDQAAAAAAKPMFATCAACHGADGKGNQALGAPNLTDDVWLHGSSLADIEQTIRDGREGHMPAWNERLGEARSRAVAAYVYHLSHREQGARN